MTLPAGVYRADQVGSLLRPKAVLEARERAGKGEITTEELRAIEDAAITNAVEKQLQVGLRAVTDGEFRRAYFHLDFLKQLDGVQVKGQIGNIRHDTDGFSPPQLIVSGKLAHSRPIQVPDYLFLKRSLESSPLDNDGRARATVKVAIPSPTMVHFRGGRASIDITSYPDLDVFFADLAAVYRQEFSDLYDAGCRFVQLDDTNLAYLCDPEMRAAAERRNEDLSILPRKYAELINNAIRGRPKDMKVGIHLCRGNYRSQWFASGGYEPVAEILFKELEVDVYFLEYDDSRSGDFAPLRYLPADKVVVLGLLSSKIRTLENKEGVVQRLKEAARYCPGGLQQLCLSCQCGFSSTAEGNEISEEEQWDKLRLEVEIAKSVWGDDLSQ